MEKDTELMSGPGHGHIEHPSLLLDLFRRHGSLLGDPALVAVRQVHGIKLKPFGGVHGHQGDPLCPFLCLLQGLCSIFNILFHILHRHKLSGKRLELFRGPRKLLRPFGPIFFQQVILVPYHLADIVYLQVELSAAQMLQILKKPSQVILHGRHIPIP